ncbi:hypothetical protein NEOLEDRAFT_1135735 [Neolentinus lepideus HHB14362 ss-1]|uniref:Uncharacterized protein n=1 Tax=Neolentinus lepideus HHB14362 ss-1 TaxID=1314782 RepID=A0A165RJH9_9AGAM|nr:hypothetical protein NEOLEDRAFT_1135735 [Neolentinus lepideus HHB14362 ss-1]
MDELENNRVTVSSDQPRIQRQRRISQITSTLSSSPIARAPRQRLSSLPTLQEIPLPSRTVSKSPSLTTSRAPRPSLTPARPSRPAPNAPPPPTPSSVPIYLLLTRLLPPELAVPILNLSAHFRRRSSHRHLETIVGARGLSVAERERRKKVYLDIAVGGAHSKRVRRIVWVVRMPSPVNGVRMRASGNGVWVGAGEAQRNRLIHPFEVSLHRENPEPPAYAEILRVPLSVPLPAHAKTRFVVSWDAAHELVRAVRTGDRVKLVLPAVYGRERGDMNWDMLGDGGFVRGEIWEAECYIYEEW